jgi:hypothetical protein
VIPPDFVRIDVDLDHGRLARRRCVVQGGRLSGLAADVDDVVGVGQDPVCDRVAHRAAHAQRQAMVLPQNALPAHRRHHRAFEPLGQRANFVVRA